MEYLFILGRNIELSIAEIKAFFEKEGIEIISHHLVNNGFLVKSNLPIEEDSIKKLGGTISIGKVIAKGKEGELFENLEKILIYTGEKNKLTYTVWDFSSLYDEILDYLKHRFRKEKIKGAFKGLTGKIKSQDGEEEFRPSSKLIEEEYFIFESEKIQYFGKIESYYDSKEVEKRDMEKPFRRHELAISPRLAKIMINLAKLKQGNRLYDPFCGIGVIMQEALLQGITAIGSDLDEKAIQGARKNMEWFGFSKEDYDLICGNSKKITIDGANGIATEPDLGQILKKIPTKQKAENTLKSFENLMIDVINNSKNKISGRIVFTSPYIRIGKKRLSCNIEKICEKTGYHLVQDGIEEYRGNQIVGRMIYILER